jgi:hypothetical protein
MQPGPLKNLMIYTRLYKMKPVHNSEAGFSGLFEVGERASKANPKANLRKMLNCWKNSA